MKKIVKIIVCIFLFLVLIVATLPLWISPAVSNAVKLGAPKFLGVDASVGSVRLNPFTGTLAIQDVRLVNPVNKGYSTNDSFSVAKIEVVVAMGSILSNPVHLKKIEIADPKIRYELKGTTSNFSAMLANLKKDEGEAPKAQEKKPETEKKPEERKADKESKVIIDVVSLHGAQVDIATIVTLGAGVPVPLPPITLHDIGKKTNGTSWMSAISDIFGAIIDGVSALASGTIKLGADVVKEVGGGVAKGIGAISSLVTGDDDSKASKEKAKEAVKTLGGEKASKKVEKASKELEKLDGTVKEGASTVKAVGDAIGGLFGGSKKKESK